MIVAVDALFSHNHMIGSKMIANGTSFLSPKMPKTSHVAILINKRWVHESTGHSGVQVMSYDLWSKYHTEVYRVGLPDMEYQTVADLFRSILGKKYDYLGVFYLGLRIAAKLIFNLNIPEENKWESSNKFFCCEVLGYLVDKNYDMMAPVQILESLRK